MMHLLPLDSLDDLIDRVEQLDQPERIRSKSSRASTLFNQQYALVTLLAVMALSIALSGCRPHDAGSTARVVAHGYIEGEESRLGVLVPGTVSAITVAEGDAVKKGEVLLRLDDEEAVRQSRDLEQMVRELEKTKVQIESVLDRLKKQAGRPVSACRAKEHQAEAIAPAGGQRQSSRIESESPGRTVNTKDEKNSPEDQSKPIESRLAIEERALADGAASQQAMLEREQSAALSTLEQAHQAQLSELDEAKGLSFEKSGFELPFLSMNKFRERAFDSVLKSKKKAIDQVFETKKQALKEVFAARSESINQAVDAKRAALEQASEAESQAEHEARALVERSIGKEARALDQNFKTMRSLVLRLRSDLEREKRQFAQTTSQTGLHLQLNEAELKLSAVTADLLKARTALNELRSKLKLFTVKSPFDGVCTAINVKPGETAAPGQVLIRVTDPGKICLRGFVTERDLGKIKLGESGRVRLDSQPGQSLPARVVAIDSQASFTPENVYFKEDRIWQSFAVKLAIDEGDATAKPGMSASAEIGPADSIASGESQ